MSDSVIKQAINSGISYKEYREQTRVYLNEDDSVLPYKEDYKHYVELNDARMHRVDKTFKLASELSKSLSLVKKPVYLIVITEAWCGDAAHTVPVVCNAVEGNSLIEVKVVYRDENIDLMNQFLTNGGMAIPIFVLVEKESESVLGSWGPRPKEAQELVLAYKALKDKPPYEELSKTLQKWYNKDKTVSTQGELIDFFTLA